jgi:predicted nucleotidyltransferase
VSDVPAMSPVEGFAIETVSGSIFTVKGLVHPPDRVVAYLRYVPDPSGERGHGRRRYRRVYAFSEQLAALGADGQDVLIDDPMFGTRLQAVPAGRIARLFDPRLRLASLRQSDPSDPLEEAALRLVELLRSSAGVEGSSLGVTGSLLFGLHTEASDLDLVVYGSRQGRRVRAALAGLLDGDSTPVRRPRGAELAAIHAAHRSETPLSAEEFAEAQARKVNEGRFGTRPFFIRFVKLPSEIAERYGDPRYRSCGRATLIARVDDDADALFTPCGYGVTDVRLLEGESVDEVRSIVSFRGRFADQARAGETVVARGVLERVISPGAPAWSRLVVGGQAGDYLARYAG